MSCQRGENQYCFAEIQGTFEIIVGEIAIKSPCKLSWEWALGGISQLRVRRLGKLPEGHRLLQTAWVFPKLRIYFADFHSLLCSIDQRLLTLET